MLTLLERRLVAVGAWLLALVYGLLAADAMFALQARYREEQVVQAGIVAQSLAYRLASEAPGGRLPAQATVASAAEAVLADAPAFLEVAVLDPAGTVLWQSAHWSGDDGFQLRDPILVAGVPLGRVAMRIGPHSALRALWLPALVALCLWGLSVLVAREALRFLIRRGPLLRDLASAAMVDRIAGQDFTTLITEGARAPLDQRAATWASHVRNMYEVYFRLRRLIESLLQTEPDPAQRQRLETLLKDAHGGTRFEKDKPRELKLATIEVDIRWLCLTTFAALGLFGALLFQQRGAVSAILAIAAAAGGAWLALWLSRTVMRGGTPLQFAQFGLGVMLASVLGAMLWQALRAPIEFTGSAWDWVRAIWQYLLIGLTWLTFVAATTGATWVLIGGRMAIRVAHEEGAPAMPQSWVWGLALGGHAVGLLLGQLLPMMLTPERALVGALLAVAVAVSAFLISRLSAAGWTGYQFQRADTSAWPALVRDVPRLYALTAGALLALGHSLPFVWMGSGFAPLDRVSCILGFTALMAGGALLSMVARVSQRLRALPLMLLVPVLLVWLLPDQVLPSQARLVAYAAGVLLLGYATWHLRLAAWQHADVAIAEPGRLLKSDLGAAAGMALALALVPGLPVIGLAVYLLLALLLCATLVRMLMPPREAGRAD